MNLEILESVITNIVTVLSIIAGLAPLFIAVLKWLRPRTTNQRIAVLESYALRVVQAVEQQANLMPSDKKKLAMDKLAEYISASPLKLKVTSKQMSDLIEAAVNKLNDDATPGTKVASEAATDAPEKAPETEELTDAQKEALEYMKAQQNQEVQQ